MLRKNKDYIKRLEQLVLEAKDWHGRIDALLKRLDLEYANGKVLLLEDITDNVVNRLMELARDDRTIVLRSKDGHVIEIHDKVDEPKKRKNLF